MGFFFQVSSKDYQSIEKVIQEIVKRRQPFERIEVSKLDLMEMFQYNQFKLRFIETKVVSDTATIYRCGNLIDMCRGPHVIHTGKLKHFKITNVIHVGNFWFIAIPFISTIFLIETELAGILERRFGGRET